MTIASKFQSLSLPILVSDPLWLDGRCGYIETLTSQVSGYEHTISDTIGYDTARIVVNLPLIHAEDWLINGLGKHIVTKSEALVVIWEGFVNKITFKVGTTTIPVGPLIDINNKSAVTYSTIDTSTDPPTYGIRTTTAFSSDTTSQARYAIWEKILSQGGATAVLAQQVRDKFLSEGKDPPRTSDDNFSQVNQPQVRIECLGYYHFLNAYIWNQTGVSGTVNLSTKITDILGADPNSIFSTDYSNIATNTIRVQDYENDDAVAKNLIEDLVGIGDTSDNRYTFMVLKDRKVHYQQASTTTDYVFRLSERARILEDTIGNRIRPWEAMPGKWRKVPDLLVGRSQPSDIKTDLRQSYITKVTFNAPDRLRLSGTELEELPQLLAKAAGGVQVQ